MVQEQLTLPLRMKPMHALPIPEATPSNLAQSLHSRSLGLLTTRGLPIGPNQRAPPPRKLQSPNHARQAFSPSSQWRKLLASPPARAHTTRVNTQYTSNNPSPASHLSMRGILHPRPERLLGQVFPRVQSRLGVLLDHFFNVVQHFWRDRQFAAAVLQ